MSCMGLYLIRKKHVRNGAQWYGKICTAVVDVGMVFLLLFPDLSEGIANGVIWAMIGFMIFSLVNYVRFHMRILNEQGC